MAGLHHPLRPTSHHFLPSSSSANLSPHLSGHQFASRILLILAFLPLSLATFAFFLQWRGGFNDPISHSSPHSRLEFPGMQSSASPYGNRAAAASDCDRVSGDVLSQSSSLAFPYRQLSFNHKDFNPGPKVSVTTSTSAGLEQILPWIFYHKITGITEFFLFVEGKAASSNVSRVLQSIPGVKVTFRTKELEEQQSKSRIWNETWLGNFFYKPCNYELFVKQTLNMEMAIVMARSAGMDWIFHLDTDELIYPAGTRDYSVRELLSNIGQDVDIVVFPNYEGGVEHAQVREPFSEVSLFKKNYDHLPKETYFGSYKEATRGNPNYFLTYGNGKSAARLQDHLRPNGAHRWQNYNKSPNEIKLDEPAVLHYTYTKYSDLTSRRDRCGCKPTKEDVKRCFMLEFDRDAFIIASTVTQEEMMRWYQDRVVWGNKDLKLKLIRKGILTRIYAPMIIIQGLKESGVFTSVIASSQASPSENYKNSTLWEERKSFINELSRRSSSTAAKKIMEIVDSRSDHPMAVEPLSSPSPDEIFHAAKPNTY